MNRAVELLWKGTLKNLVISIIVFVLLMECMLLFKVPIVYDAIFFCSFAASIIGVAYVLTIRNPQNYTGFYLGIVSSALLGVQFFLMGSYDLTFLYFIVFIPFQALSIYKWLHASKKEEKPFRPTYLNASTRTWALLIFGAIILIDFLLIAYWLDPLAPLQIKLVNGILIASSVLANFLLIWKKIDSWFFWLVYSVDGLLLAIFINNVYNILLFCIFLIINLLTMLSWIANHRRMKRLEEL